MSWIIDDLRCCGANREPLCDLAADEIEALEARVATLETTLQEAETKLKAAEDAVVVLRKVFEDEEAIFSSNPYPPTLGPQAFLRHKMLQDLLFNTSALAAQRKREIVREAVEQACDRVINCGPLSAQTPEGVLKAILGTTERA